MRKLIYRRHKSFDFALCILAFRRIAKDNHITFRTHFRLGRVVVINRQRLNRVILDIRLKLCITQVLLRAFFVLIAKEPEAEDDKHQQIKERTEPATPIILFVIWSVAFRANRWFLSVTHTQRSAISVIFPSDHRFSMS